MHAHMHVQPYVWLLNKTFRSPFYTYSYPVDYNIIIILLLSFLSFVIVFKYPTLIYISGLLQFLQLRLQECVFLAHNIIATWL